MACLLGFTATMSAETVLEVKNFTNEDGTFVEATDKAAAHYQPVNSFNLGEYSFAFEKGSGSTEPALYGSTVASGKDEWTVRIYVNNTMTFTAPAGTTMTKVVFSDGSNGTKDAAHTVDTGAISNVTTTGFTWTGSASQFTVTAVKSIRFAKVTVYVDGEVNVDPDPVEATTVNNLKEAKALAADTPYILNCEPVVVYSYKSYNFLYDGANYALLYGPTDLKAGDKIKSGSTGKVANFNNLIQLAPTKYEIDGTGTIPSPEVIPFDDITATMTASNQDLYITIKGVKIGKDNLQLGTVSAEGETINVNLYNRSSLTIKPGTYDITGFIGVYQTTVQLNIAEMVGEADPIEVGGTGEGTAESPYDCTRAIDIVKNGLQTADEVYVKGTVVSLKTAVTDIDKYHNIDYWISDDGTAENQLQVFRGLYFDGAEFTSENAVKAGDVVVVKGVLTLYNTTVELDKGNQLVELNGNLGGVENVNIDLNAPVEYFNLQGQRIENPANGLYIRRQAGKAVKVVL